MHKKNVTVIFDRLGSVKKTRRGKIEIRVYLDRNVRKPQRVRSNAVLTGLCPEDSNEIGECRNIHIFEFFAKVRSRNGRWKDSLTLYINEKRVKFRTFANR